MLARLLVLVAAFFASAAPALAANEPPPLEAYGDLPDIEDMAISPDGKRIASVRRIAGRRHLFDEVSPRRFASRADAPIQLIHGKDDTVVPFRQSERMANALKDAGKPHEFIALRREDHWLSHAETRKQTLKEAMRFVRKHNPPD
jgi:alpha-beta hydrolase superfamily lysophospholipase